MKILITENQMASIAVNFLLDKLNDMDFNLMKNKDFSFFPKGDHRAEHGIEADWHSKKGYSILVGHSLWRSIRDTFGMDNDQTEDIFIKVFNEKGINKIYEVSSIDFSDVMDTIYDN